MAPKASRHFVKKLEKRQIKTRPMPDSKVQEFCLELTQYKWEDVLETEDPHLKVELFQSYLMGLKDKFFPEKVITVSSLDKQWMNPELKVLLRQVQRERLKNGKMGKFKSLWAKLRRLKRAQIKKYTKKVVQEMKITNPSKWYQMMRKLGGLDQMDRGRLELDCLEGLTDQECAEAVARSFRRLARNIPHSTESNFLLSCRREDQKVSIFFRSKRV